MKKLLALTFTLALVLTACGPKKEGKLAKVGDEYIIEEDLDEVLDMYRQQYGEDIFDLETEEGQNALLQIKPEALNQLIYQKMSEKMVEEYDIEVTDEEVDETLEQLIAQFGGEDAFEEILAEEETTKEELKENIKKNIENQKLQEKIAELNEPSEEEVMEAVQKDKEEKVEYDADHILISTKPEQPEITETTLDGESEEEVEAPTEEELEEIRQEALQKAEELHKEIVDGGKDFAEVAKEESDDPGSAEEGGALGKFLKGAMVPEFEEALENMEIGDISEPVESDFGFHIIRLNGVAKGFDELSEESQEQIKGQFHQQILQENVDKFFEEKEKEYGVERY